MEVLERLHEAGAVLLDRHFVYTSGKHGSDFVRIDALLSRDELLDEICSELVVPFLKDEVEAVTACTDDRCDRLAALSAGHLGVKAAGGETLRGKRTLIVEDVLTTGGSVAAIRQEAEFYGAVVLGASVIVNRGDVTPEDLGVSQLESLVDVDMIAFEPENCVLCNDDRRPIALDVGRGRQYQQANPNYPGGYELLLVA